MHSDVNHSAHADLLKEKLYQKIISAIKVANSRQQVIDYCDIIYLINDKKIKQNVIKTFLHYLYGDNLDEININWQSKLTNQQILQDICKIKKKAVQEQWTSQNIDEKQIKLKEQRYKDYESRAKTRKQINYRIKQLNDQLKIIENNINMSKSQSQQLQLREKYNQMREQYRFLTNKSRKLKHLSEEKKINDSLSKSQEKLIQIQERIDQISKQESRLQQIQCLKLNKQTNIQTSPYKQKSRLKKLQEIFVKFSKKEAKQLILFDQMMKNQRFMGLQNYLKMLSKSGVGNLVNLDERVNIFKKASSFNSKINFLQFQQILRLLCVQQCEKLKIGFNSSIFEAFLSGMINRLQVSHHKLPTIPILSKSNDFIKDLRSQVFSNYQFKIKGHTGKQKQDIEQFLKEKKLSNKTQPCNSSSSSMLSNLTLEKITTNSSQVSNQSDRIFKQGKKFTKRKYANTNSNISNYKTVGINHQSASQTRSFKTSFQNDSYSNIFLKKRSILKKEKLLQQQKNRYLLQEQDLSTSVVKGDFINKLTPIRYLIGQREGQTEELRDIVEIDEDDPFLTSHFAHKYSLSTSKSPSFDSKYPF